MGKVVESVRMEPFQPELAASIKPDAMQQSSSGRLVFQNPHVSCATVQSVEYTAGYQLVRS
jgi:hypothetical protein